MRALAWVADGVDDSETSAAELLIRCARSYTEVFEILLNMPWVADGITPAETEAIHGFRWSARYAPDLVGRMMQQAWVHDEITVDEAKAVTYLYRAGRHKPDLANKLLAKPWAQDDITRDEASVIRNLYLTARAQDETLDKETTAAAITILAMPFLDTVQKADASAMESLRKLERDHTSRFLEILSHPTLSDGISDDEAKIVALLWGTNTYWPDSVDVLLSGGGVFLEEREIRLPLAGDVLLAVIRIRDQSTPSMDFLEHSVRTLEEFMGVPFPTSYVAWYLDDATSDAAGGTNFVTHIASRLHFDVENGRSWHRTPYMIAHEVAHYYWRGNTQDWVDEGPADFFSLISENSRSGSPVQARNRPCAAAKTISDLEAIAIREGSWAATEEGKLQWCHYYLGEAIFLDLYHAVGEDHFQRGFREIGRAHV